MNFKHLVFTGSAILTLFTQNLLAQAVCDPEPLDLVPFLDLQTGTYLGYQAGLYPGGTNILSGTHLNDAKSIAKGIKPLDGDGNINYGDGVVLVAGFGPSVPGHIYNSFVDKVRNPSVTYDLNPCLDAINLCIGGKDINYGIDDTLYEFYWQAILDKVTDVGYTAAQVQIGWMYFNEKGLTEPPVFPDNSLELTESYIQFINKAKDYFPNLQLMYISSRHFGGFADTTLTEYYSLAEPASYQNNWTVKWTIEEQINATDIRLKYKGASPNAPLLLWGPNFWCNAEQKRMWDKKRYDCETSFNPEDGYHLTDMQDGKDATDILNVLYYGVVGKSFTKNSATWASCVPYLDTLAGMREQQPLGDFDLNVSPNPGTGEFYLSLPTDSYAAEIVITNNLGQVIATWKQDENLSTEVLVDITGQPDGLYVARVWQNQQVYTARFIKQQ